MELGGVVEIKPLISSRSLGQMSGGESDGGGMASPGTSSMDELSSDAEGIWSPDIEQSFQEALAIYPPCGRRKIILSDEGKMYGRNELIARYIKLRTGKTRTRKQVSSHIQVLTRRKTKESTPHIKVSDSGSGGPPQIHDRKDPSLVNPNMSPPSMSSPPISSAAAAAILQQKFVGMATAAMASPSLQSLQSGPPQNMPIGYFLASAGGYPPAAAYQPPQLWNPSVSVSEPSYSNYPLEKPLLALEPLQPWRDRSIAGPKLRLVELSAFVENPQCQDLYNGRHLFVHISNNLTYADPILEKVDIQQFVDKFPDKNGGLRELYDKGPQSAFFLVKFWADINTDAMDDVDSFYGVSALYESYTDMAIECSTKVCSFGKQVVEKIEVEYSQPDVRPFTYRIDRSPMCEYLVNFIHKLKHLPEKFMMNSVLENFTILQVVMDKETHETLLCIAYVFEVSSSDHGTQHHIYRLIKD